MFSHTPVVYVNQDVWSQIAQPNQKDYSAIALRTDKEVKNAHVIEKKKFFKVYQDIKKNKGH